MLINSHDSHSSKWVYLPNGSQEGRISNDTIKWYHGDFVMKFLGDQGVVNELKEEIFYIFSYQGATFHQSGMLFYLSKGSKEGRTIHDTTR